MRLVISGTGHLSPLGADNESLMASFSGGQEGTGEISRFTSIPGARGGEIRDLDLDALINDRKFRRAADVSKYAMAAIRLAVNDAGQETVKGESSAMVAAVTHGALNYTQKYHESLLTGSVEDISPILFSDSVLNAPAGNASICFGIQGAVHTIVGGAGAAIKSVMLAGGLMEEGPIKRVIVVSAEELNELSFYCRSRSGETPMSEGAGAIVIEREDAVQDPDVYCSISGFAACLDPRDREGALKTAVDRALSMAGLKKQDLDFVLFEVPPGTNMRYPDGTATFTLSRHLGRAFCVSSMWSIIVAAHMIKQGVLPGHFPVQDKGTASKDINNVLVYTLDKTGSAAAVVLSK